MSMFKRFGWFLIWLAGSILVLAAANKNDPYLIALRGAGNDGLVVVSLMAVLALIRCGVWRHGVGGKLL